MKKILVTGATGNIGSRVISELQKQNVLVRAFVRDLNKAEAMLGEKTELAIGDFADSVSVRRALEGIESVFLACSNDPRQVEYETGLIDAAVTLGVRRIVKLSALQAQIGSPVAFWDWHGKIEQHLRLSSVPSVILQPSFSMTNLLGAAEGIQHQGTLFAPAEGARISTIHPQDVAAVAAVALTGNNLSKQTHDGQTYVLTGPEIITYEQVAEKLSAATGQAIPFVAVPDEAAQQAMVVSGLPEFVAAQIIAVFRALRQGAYNQTSDTVYTLTGKVPRSFAQFAHDHASFFQPAVHKDLQPK
jgi:uncharacterized protein YbjT (DUF2867 family)